MGCNQHRICSPEELRAGHARMEQEGFAPTWHDIHAIWNLYDALRGTNMNPRICEQCGKGILEEMVGPYTLPLHGGVEIRFPRINYLRCTYCTGTSLTKEQNLRMEVLMKEALNGHKDNRS